MTSLAMVAQAFWLSPQPAKFRPSRFLSEGVQRANGSRWSLNVTEPIVLR